MFPTASMIEKEAPTKYEREMVSQDNTVRKNSVFVHVQLLQAKDVFVCIFQWKNDQITTKNWLH